MPSTEYDLRYLRAALPVLENYLLSKDTYWPIGVNSPKGTSPYPQLTPGGILLAGKRLGVAILSGSQQKELAKIQFDLDYMRSRWRKAWSKKAAAEFNARLRLWSDFLEEYYDQPEMHTNRYAYEVTRRVLLQLLEPDAAPIPVASLENLSSLDTLLQKAFIPGGFIWEDSLVVAFPAGLFWYLYGKLNA